MKNSAGTVWFIVALIFCAFLFILKYSSHENDKPLRNAASPLWNRLGPAAKGVLLVKVNTPNGNEYFVVDGTNWRLSISEIKKYGIRFESLESLAEFLAAKPKGYIVVPGDSRSINDDFVSLGEFTPVERAMIRRLLESSEPGTTSGYW